MSVTFAGEPVTLIAGFEMSSPTGGTGGCAPPALESPTDDAPWKGPVSLLVRDLGAELTVVEVARLKTDWFGG